MFPKTKKGLRLSYMCLSKNITVSMWGNSHSKEFPHMTRGEMVGYCISYIQNNTWPCRGTKFHTRFHLTSSVERISPVRVPNKLNVFQHTYVHVRRVHM